MTYLTALVHNTPTSNPRSHNTAQDVILRGTVVTPDKVIQKGWIVINKEGKIDSIGDQVPPSTAPLVIDTGAIIFPGFVDLHNHPMYNIFGRWHPPKKFRNRDEWRDLQAYKDALGTRVTTSNAGTITIKLSAILMSMRKFSR